MLEALTRLWTLQVQVFPVLIALLVLELPGFIQRRYRLAYVPIYFTLFPLGELNKDLSVYLGEDFWYGSHLTDAEAEDLRRSLMFKSMLSMTLAALVVPLLTGFIVSFFLAPAILSEFLMCAIVLKSYRIVRAVHDFPQHANGTLRNRLFLGFIYLLYLGVLVQMIFMSYQWTRPLVTAGDWSAILSGVSDFLFAKIVAQLVIVSLLTAAFVSIVADRNLRIQNIRQSESTDEPKN